jgi:hypothetical protein
MTGPQDIIKALKIEGRFLCFRHVEDEVPHLTNALLLVGFMAAWLAGMGRYWDNSRAAIWQHMGLGSIAFIFIFTTFIWLLMMPLRPKAWHYKQVLVFVAMTAPLGFIYAIPVERFFPLDTAQTINVWFLAVVSVLRISLLVTFLKRSAGFGIMTGITATLLPLVVIVAALTMLNLEQVVFNIMGGVREEDRSGNDVAYEIMVGITVLSVYAAPIFLGAYGVLIALRRRAGRRK